MYNEEIIYNKKFSIPYIMIKEKNGTIIVF